MRREIEVKAKINNLDEIANKLVGLGCVFSKPIEQHDTIFVEDDYGPFEQFQPKKNLLRIREAEGEFIFTLKRPQTNQLDSIEHETKIDDPNEMKAILNLMGYKEIIKVHKIRRKTKYNNWEICLDQVDQLGTFIEVEKISDESGAKKVQNELFNFLRSLGVQDKDRVYEGYDTLIYLNAKVVQINDPKP